MGVEFTPDGCDFMNEVFTHFMCHEMHYHEAVAYYQLG